MTTMNDCQAALQAALFTLLSTASYFTTNSVAVYDQVAKDTPVPFITIGDMTVVDDSTQGISKQVVTLMVHSWDQNLSSLRLKQTMGAIVTLLHDQTLTLSTGFVNSNTRFMNSQTFKDPDGMTLHGVQKFRIVVENQ